MSFLSALKAGANVVAAKTKAVVADLKAFPTETVCKQCEKPVMVPPEVWNWGCDACGIVNFANNEVCAGCSGPAPKEPHPVVVACTMCKHENEVPRSNIRKHAKNAVITTKKVARKTSEAVKKEYAHQKDTPDQFPCKNCNTMLLNPNKRPAAAAAAAPPPVAMEHPEQAAAAPLLQEEIKEVQCPVCSQVTSIPGTNFVASVTKAAVSAKVSLTRVYLNVAGKKFANCPVCAHPCKAPEHARVDEGAAAPATAEGAQHAEQRKKFDLTCSKCNASFPVLL